MASRLLDAQQLRVLLCQQVYHGGDDPQQIDCPRGQTDKELEAAKKLIRLYGETPRMAEDKAETSPD